MVIQCNSCGQRYNLDEAKIPGKGARVTCPTCKTKFIVMKPGSQPAAPAANDDPAFAPQTPPPPEQTASAPAQQVAPRGIRSWQVRVGSGLVYDFTDVATLKTWLVEGKVVLSDQISTDGANWVPLANIPNLDEFFTSPAAQSAPPVAPAPGAEGPSTQVSNNPLAAAFAGPNDPFAQFNTGTGPSAPIAPQEITTTAPAAVAATAQPQPGTQPPPAVPPGGFNPFEQSTNPGVGSNGPAPGGPPASAGPVEPTPTVVTMPPQDAGAPADPLEGIDPFGGPPVSAPPPGTEPTDAGFDLWGEGSEERTIPSTDAPPMAPAAAVATAGNGPPPPQEASLFGPANEGTPTTAQPPVATAPPPVPDATSISPQAPAAGPSASPEPTNVQQSNPFMDAGEGLQLDKPTTKPKQEKSKKDIASMRTGATGPRPPRRGRGRIVVLLVLLVIAIGGAVGAFFFREQVLTAFNQVMERIRGPAPTPTPPPRNVVVALDGEARAAFVAGRRLVRMNDPDAHSEAVQKFDQAKGLAENNPMAIAGTLEALSVRRLLGADVADEELQVASAAATQAWRDLSNHVTTNRARGAFYLATEDSGQALSFLESALESSPNDSEAKALRGWTKLKDEATKSEGLDDLRAALKADPALAWAYTPLIEAAPKREARRLRKSLTRLSRKDQQTRTAIAGGKFEPTEKELALLLVPVQVATAAPTPEETPEPTPTATLVAVTATVATPKPTTTAVAPTATAVVVNTPAPTPTVAATATVVATPAETPTIVPLTPTPTAALTDTEGTPTEATPTPVATADGGATATPGPTATTLKASAQDHFVAGQALLKANNADGAAEELEQAVQLKPNNPLFRSELGWAYYKAGKRKEAVSTLETAVQLNQMSPVPHRRLGLIFEGMGRRQEACIHFENYIRLAPNASDVPKIEARRQRLGC